MSSTSRQIDWGTTLTAVAIAVVAVLALWQAQEFSALGSIFPLFVGGALLISSLAVLVRSLMANAAGPKVSDDSDRAGLRRSLALVATMILWVLMLEWVGFAISSWLSFVALALIADGERPILRRTAVFAVAGLAVVGGLQLVFQYGLKVRLPAGELLPQLFG
jgi:hypothetical protein